MYKVQKGPRSYISLVTISDPKFKFLTNYFIASIHLQQE